MENKLPYYLTGMQKVSKTEFYKFFKENRFLSHNYYHTEDGNKIYTQKNSKNRENLAAYIYETKEYFIKK